MPEVEYRLPHTAEAASTARRLAREEVAGALEGAPLDAFLLLTHELVSNAVRHAPPESDGMIAIRFEIGPTTVRAVAMDGGGDFEFDRATFDADTPHFGLRLVDRLASRWGLSLDGEKAVWFEIDRSTPDA